MAAQGAPGANVPGQGDRRLQPARALRYPHGGAHRQRTSTDTHRRQLAEVLSRVPGRDGKAGLSSIAFCCISTGVFGFPQEEAASIAVATVRRWLNEHPDVPMTVVFNVFSETDESLYRPLLGLVGGIVTLYCLHSNPMKKGAAMLEVRVARPDEFDAVRSTRR